MAKKANPGELRTMVEILALEGGGVDEDGYETSEYVNVFGPGVTVPCKWVNAHGSEVLEAATLGLREPATLTLRYTGKLTPLCRIRRGEAVYGVVSVDNVEQRDQWMEVKVKREVSG